ncbi:Hypothetical protein, predicted transmembrane protein [Metamycoplasma auris 15026]|uniref:Uncharacterized protein n=1 Tax=Metamycoplasma auris 15026 TaxID=1188233 RepID=N9UZP7_9BACT|nr:hypothetical protein [Metamycoplasma auris]ENY68647.1 Hypothetical protein, predicted transmembrane protein [Metamycoplasma auris 15026]
MKKIHKLLLGFGFVVALSTTPVIFISTKKNNNSTNPNANNGINRKIKEDIDINKNPTPNQPVNNKHIKKLEKTSAEITGKLFDDTYTDLTKEALERKDKSDKTKKAEKHKNDSARITGELFDILTKNIDKKSIEKAERADLKEKDKIVAAYLDEVKKLNEETARDLIDEEKPIKELQLEKLEEINKKAANKIKRLADKYINQKKYDHLEPEDVLDILKAIKGMENLRLGDFEEVIISEYKLIIKANNDSSLVKGQFEYSPRIEKEEIPKLKNELITFLGHKLDPYFKKGIDVIPIIDSLDFDNIQTIHDLFNIREEIRYFIKDYYRPTGEVISDWKYGEHNILDVEKITDYRKLWEDDERGIKPKKYRYDYIIYTTKERIDEAIKKASRNSENEHLERFYHFRGFFISLDYQLSEYYEVDALFNKYLRSEEIIETIYNPNLKWEYKMKKRDKEI